MISERRYSAKIILSSSKRDEVIRLCEQHIGPRIYYLHRNLGGKKWYVTSEGVKPGEIELGVADEAMLSFLALQLS